ncbi:unnamed protein product [Ostreobium quekettii]|uniref:RRM domain-containing protein n=1 Tax=Ostreobium quekettii TaxID=121088 RepID=A0A8S1J100_9CHLO|nr:unnamed protein product [Ostreobium quekettii]|eukprot:evm.model.scf_3007.1 EVM.evm.TU.scf_3007.1   scf_3007:3697-6619(+)
MAEAEGLGMTLDQIIQRRESSGGARYSARTGGPAGKRGAGRGGRWASRRRGGMGGRIGGGGRRLGVNARMRKVVRRPGRWGGRRYQMKEGRPNAWKAQQFDVLEGSGKWKHDMFDAQDDRPARRMNFYGKHQLETTKILISNLEYNVTDEDIQELFISVGPIKRAGIHYERSSGRSKGTAEVVYERRSDAEEAIRRFNDVCLDGKPLVMQLCKTSASECRSYITTLSSGISVTDPKTAKRLENPYYQTGFDPLSQSSKCINRGHLLLSMRGEALNGEESQQNLLGMRMLNVQSSSMRCP